VKEPKKRKSAKTNARYTDEETIEDPSQTDEAASKRANDEYAKMRKRQSMDVRCTDEEKREEAKRQPAQA
jgi:hypothetical protein